MSIPNRASLDALSTMSIDSIAALPADQLALLHAEAAEALAKLRSLKERLDSGTDAKYREAAARLRREAGKDTGAVRIADGGMTVVADLPKRVKWNQRQLATIVERIRAGGDDSADYVTTEFTVSERAYGAWPKTIRVVFEPARTVETGRPAYRFETSSEGRD